MFYLSCWNLPNHDPSWCALGIFRKTLMSKGASSWFKTVWTYSVGAIDYWIIFFNEKLIKLKLKTILEFGDCWKTLVKFSKVNFTIFRTKVWKILLFEWILLLKIQTNCKNWVWKEKSLSPQCVHTWANGTCYTYQWKWCKQNQIT